MARKKAAKRPARRVPRLTFSFPGEPLTKRQLHQVDDLLGSWPLLPDFERFLLKYNGGTPDPALYFDRRPPTEGDRRSHLDDLLGVDPGRLDDGRFDCIRCTMQRRSDLPRHALAIGFVDRDDLLLLFTGGPRKGQVWLLSWNQIVGPHPDPVDPETAISFVAETFGDFLASLYRLPDQGPPLAFALDAPRVRGKRLAELLKTLGCKKWRYKGVAYSATPLPPQWEWPKYRRSGEDEHPAVVSVEKNKTYGYSPKFDERPPRHQVLLVNVTASQRKACARELAAALGESAVRLVF